jgi:predicted PolB exonuclease-like 3'-5' exonuclease
VQFESFTRTSRRETFARRVPDFLPVYLRQFVQRREKQGGAFLRRPIDRIVRSNEMRKEEKTRTWTLDGTIKNPVVR